MQNFCWINLTYIIKKFCFFSAAIKYFSVLGKRTMVSAQIELSLSELTILNCPWETEYIFWTQQHLDMKDVHVLCTLIKWMNSEVTNFWMEPQVCLLYHDVVPKNSIPLRYHINWRDHFCMQTQFSHNLNDWASSSIYTEELSAHRCHLQFVCDSTNCNTVVIKVKSFRWVDICMKLHHQDNVCSCAIIYTLSKITWYLVNFSTWSIYVWCIDFDLKNV